MPPRHVHNCPPALFTSLPKTSQARKIQRTCTATSCDVDGVCEERACEILDGYEEAEAARAVFVSCQSCKLQHLSDLRRWLQMTENGQATRTCR